jgi:hypothetical protein
VKKENRVERKEIRGEKKRGENNFEKYHYQNLSSR